MVYWVSNARGHIAACVDNMGQTRIGPELILFLHFEIFSEPILVWQLTIYLASLGTDIEPWLLSLNQN